MPVASAHTLGPLQFDRALLRPNGRGGSTMPFDVQDRSSNGTPPIEMLQRLPRRRVVVPPETLRKLDIPSVRTFGSALPSKAVVEYMSPGDVALLNSIETGAASKDIADDQVQLLRDWGAQLLFHYVSLKNGVLFLPNVGDSVRSYFSNEDAQHELSCSGIFGDTSLGLACRKVCKAVIAVQAIKAFHEVPDKEAFVFPCLSRSDDWSCYPNVRQLKDIAYVGTTGAQASAATLIQSLRTRKLRRDVARKFVAGFVDTIVLESSFEDDEETWGRVHASYDIRRLALAASGMNVGTLLHETEHMRFREIVHPLLASGMLSARPGDGVVTSDDLPGHLLQRFAKLVSKEKLISQDGGYTLDKDYVASEPAGDLLNELFANLRQADALFFHAGGPGITEDRYKASLAVDVMILKKAADRLVEFDPLLRAVVDAHVSVALKQCGFDHPFKAIRTLLKLKWRK